MSVCWCVVAYRHMGTMEIHGPYQVRAVAATASAVIAAREPYEAAYVIEMVPGEEIKWQVPPGNRNTQWDDLNAEIAAEVTPDPTPRHDCVMDDNLGCLACDAEAKP